MSVPISYDLTQWTQPVKKLSAEWRRHALSSYVDATPVPGSISIPVDIRLVETSDGNTINVSANRLGEYLPLMSVFTYFDCYPHSFDASGFRHGMRLSGHLSELHIGRKTRLTWENGHLRRWLH